MRVDRRFVRNNDTRQRLYVLRYSTLNVSITIIDKEIKQTLTRRKPVNAAYRATTEELKRDVAIEMPKFRMFDIGASATIRRGTEGAVGRN